MFDVIWSITLRWYTTSSTPSHDSSCLSSAERASFSAEVEATFTSYMSGSGFSCRKPTKSSPR